MNRIYDAPKYYELAFSYRDLPNEVAVMEACIQQFSRCPVRTVLEICCGHAPHIEALHHRGYAYIGVDRSQTMLARAQERAAECAVDARFIQASLCDFALDAPVDFAYVALASLYVTTSEELRQHFDAMGKAVQSGGLYFMEWCVDFDPMVDVIDSWNISAEGIEIQASYWTCSVNRIEQQYEDTLHLEIDEAGEHFALEDKAIRRRIFPQEFLNFVRNHTAFEFVGWWNDWDLEQPLTGEHGVDRPIIVLRRR